MTKLEFNAKFKAHQTDSKPCIIWFNLPWHTLLGDGEVESKVDCRSTLNVYLQVQKILSKSHFL